MEINSNYTQAQNDLNFAVNELMRPQEDVVLLSACHSVKKALRGFLCSFLESKKKSFSEKDDIETLMNRCIKSDIDFLRFDLNRLNCKCDSGNCEKKSYCLSMEQVKDCINLVAEVDNFIASGNLLKIK